MRRASLRLALLTIAALCLYCVGVSAAEPDFVPGEERQVTWYGGTSACIGDPRSPVCAFDTMIACLVRRDEALCRSVGIEDPCKHPALTGARYKIDRIETAVDASQTNGAETVIVWYREQLCFSFLESCAGSFKSAGDGWLTKFGDQWRFPGEPMLSSDLCFDG